MWRNRKHLTVILVKISALRVATSIMHVVLRAMPKIQPRTKDATAVEEIDTSKRNVEVECKEITDRRNQAVIEELPPTPIQ